jgi:hypothetical protein
MFPPFSQQVLVKKMVLAALVALTGASQAAFATIGQAAQMTQSGAASR